MRNGWQKNSKLVTLLPCYFELQIELGEMSASGRLLPNQPYSAVRNARSDPEPWIELRNGLDHCGGRCHFVIAERRLLLRGNSTPW